MTINRKKSIMYRGKKQYVLTPLELRLMLMLANNLFNTYEEAREFAYKQDIPDKAIQTKLQEMQQKFYLHIAINNFGARLRDVIGII